MKSLRILYVEDNDYLRDTLAMLLQSEAREVVPCASGEEAWATFGQRPFDVVVTDVSLPGLSGTELARRILATRPAQWVVLCSGYEFRHGLADLGPNVRALLKPVELEDIEALMNQIAASLGRASAT